MIILISSWYTDSYYLLKVCEALRDKDIEAFLVTSSGYFNNKYGKNRFIIDFNSYKKKPVFGDKDQRRGIVKRIEEEYNLDSIYDILRSDPFTVDNIFSGENLEEAVAHFKAWEKIFSNYNPELVYTEIGGAIVRRTGFYVAKEKYSAFCYQGCFAPFKNRYFLAEGEGFDPKELYNIRDKDLEESSYRAAEALIDNFRKKSLKESEFVIHKKPKLNKYKVKQFIEYLKISKEETDNQQWQLRKWVTSFVKKFLRTQYLRFYRYDSFNPRESYIFYPLHTPIDSQVLVRGQHILNQFELIKLISLHLPYGINLCVKPHPSFVGGYKIQNFKELSEFKNIKLLNPEIDSTNIIKNAKAVFVMNSTTGLEALLLKKPVITYASSYYRNKGLTYDLESLFNLGQVLKQAITNEIPYDDSELKSFLAKLYQVSESGKTSIWGNSKKLMLKQDIDSIPNLKSNAVDFANALLRRYQTEQ